MYDAGDPHSPGNNVGNNRETITATPASDTGPPTPLRRVRGVMRFGIFVAGTIGPDNAFTPDDVNAANSTCMSGSYEYYANIVHVDDDGASESSSLGIPIDDDYVGDSRHFGDFRRHNSRRGRSPLSRGMLMALTPTETATHRRQ